MMRWIILFSCFSSRSPSLLLLYCCLLPQLMLELVMLWCFVCFRLGVSFFAFRFCYCINLYSFYYTQGSRMFRARGDGEVVGQRKEIFFCFLARLLTLFFFYLASCSGWENVDGRKKSLGRSFLHVSFLLAIFPPSTFQRSEKGKRKPLASRLPPIRARRRKSIKHFFLEAPAKWW